ncbi:MAG TPA: NYN domain-containing protein [Terracidiphilus sp.]|nr:NYN domain-containing protein [Terracidiphilus sp.]
MYVPSKKQRALIKQQFAEDNLATPFSSSQPSTPATFEPEVALLIDSQNAYHAAKKSGESTRPDYSGIRDIAASYGRLGRAQIFVTTSFKNPSRWEPEFSVVRSTDQDVDYWLVTYAVEAIAAGVKTLVVVSGDHRFLEVADICVRLGIRFIAIGVPECTSRRLKTDFEFHPMPTVKVPAAAA